MACTDSVQVAMCVLKIAIVVHCCACAVCTPSHLLLPSVLFAERDHERGGPAGLVSQVPNRPMGKHEGVVDGLGACAGRTAARGTEHCTYRG